MEDNAEDVTIKLALNFEPRMNEKVRITLSRTSTPREFRQVAAKKLKIPAHHLFFTFKGEKIGNDTESSLLTTMQMHDNCQVVVKSDVRLFKDDKGKMFMDSRCDSCPKDEQIKSCDDSKRGLDRPHTSRYHNQFAKSMKANMPKTTKLQKHIHSYRMKDKDEKILLSNSVSIGGSKTYSKNNNHDLPEQGKFYKPSGLKSITDDGKSIPPAQRRSGEVVTAQVETSGKSSNQYRGTTMAKKDGSIVMLRGTKEDTIRFDKQEYTYDNVLSDKSLADKVLPWVQTTMKSPGANYVRFIAFAKEHMEEYNLMNYFTSSSTNNAVTESPTRKKSRRSMEDSRPDFALEQIETQMSQTSV